MRPVVRFYTSHKSLTPLIQADKQCNRIYFDFFIQLPRAFYKWIVEKRTFVDFKSPAREYEHLELSN